VQHSSRIHAGTTQFGTVCGRPETGVQHGPGRLQDAVFIVCAVSMLRHTVGTEATEGVRLL
jgi:hypothetical protein